MLCNLKSNFDPVVVHVRHKRNIATLAPQGSPDFAHRFRVTDRGCCHPNDLATDVDQTQNSGDGSLNIQRVFIDHRLNNDRVLTADRYVANHHGPGDTAMDLGVVAPIQGSHGSEPESGQGSHNRCRTAARS